jgi:hypothetical protein
MKVFVRFGFLSLWLYLCCCYVPMAQAEAASPTDPIMKLGIFYPPISDSASRADVAVSFSLWVQEQSASVGVRAADVMLKEKRPLILVPRETPFSLIHLRNMTQLAESGATILPANPGFYHRPQSVNEVVDFIVARILDQLSIPHTLLPRWGEN